MVRRSEEIDICVGEAISRLRRTRGMSQNALANALGVSFQQVQKYEGGQNRVSAARLYRLAQILDCGVADFFPTSRIDTSHSAANVASLSAMTDTREGLRMMQVFPGIGDAGVRRSLVNIAEALALG